MGGKDLSSSRLAGPPLPPLPPESLDRESLRQLGRRIAERGWTAGIDRWSWGEGTFLLGAIRLAQALHEPFPEPVLRYLQRHQAAGITPGHVNDLAPGIAAALAATATGDRRYLDLVARLLDWVRTSPEATVAGNGALEHWPGSVWADTTFMAGVLLGHAAMATGDPQLLEEFGRQVIAHAELLQDPASGLIAHGTFCGRTLRHHWGRGNAWWALAAVEFLELAGAAPPAWPRTFVAEVGRRLSRQQLSLAERQPLHGVWDVLVDGQPETIGILETSAAAGLAAAALRARAVLPDLPVTIEEMGWRAIRGMLAYVDDAGTLTRVSAGTVLQLVPFGYSVIRDDRLQPWGQGLALHAVAAAIDALRQPLGTR